ncbi:succinate-semialdehyde dehydrogenase (NADP(+)) [Sphingomonas oleivorans]|uniref:Succinate-semialdehyde dehydrogenase (NADP(+)) n=1 Tax=Sphingomonas oleivorans TaxID=1735121 RepID=A0A2T5FYZ5_9SPHN|nr:NAD-dependent succinate-semialdehyde dehydrogenase [Sphingomonas oleivorans]PTQ11822.1 succinate-semialdehyde dehydrogenase (NADP(+)) [Sphingomonas oleivorans]
MLTSASNSPVPLDRADLLTEAAYVDGSWIGGNDRITVFNPANGRSIGTIPDIGAQGAETAVSAAERAIHGWRAFDAATRSAVLGRWYEAVMAHEGDLATLMVAEQGKPMAEAIGEIRYAAAYIRWFAEEARRVYGDLIPGPSASKRLAMMRQPVGVVSAITPWNFPLAMITRKAAPALAAGCTMVLKPSELTPFSALALARLADEAGVPPGVFNVVTGRPEEIGRILTDDPRVRKFSFTGSTAVGTMLAARCMATAKRVSLELGGNAPFIVFEDADIEAAMKGLVASKFRNSGQTCVCANRIYVQRGIYADFAERLAERVSRLKPGDGMIETSDQGPLIDDRAIAKVERHIADAVSHGASIIVGGIKAASEGHFFQPTVLIDVSPASLLCREETFGPVAGLVPFDGEADVIALANDSPAGLAAYVYTRDHDRVWRITEALEYGMVGVNTGLISTEVAPFGGIKQSGLGREGSRYGMDEYLEMKLVCHDIAPR